ncbi:Dihydrosphingosine phosphate lyase [Sarracenia purpurea var. burkii]
MGTEEPKDTLKGMDWKSISNSIQDEPNVGQVTKKRLPRKIRQIPDYYFLPRRSVPSAIAFYGAWIVAGVGAGMLAEIWINKKVKEDGVVIWEFDK